MVLRIQLERGTDRICARGGFTLTELSIVLGIMGSILGAIWSASSHVSANNRAQKTVTQILDIANGFRAAFPNGAINSPNWYTGYAINSGLIPANMITNPCTGAVGGVDPNWSNGSGSCGVSPWNAQVLVGGGAGVAWGVTASASSFIIGLEGYSGATLVTTNSICASVLPAILQAAGAGGLTAIYDDVDGVVPVTAATPVTAFSNCKGNVALLFAL
jgi:prepilin-type N-terminal cleavage/methylation domain-containing protein